MNNLQVFTPQNFGFLKELEQEIKGTFKGVVYGLDLGDYVKIGHTSKPYSRIHQHKIQLKNYGDWEIRKVFITVPHTNHFENERLVHQFFSKYRKEGTELFKVSFKTVLEGFQNIGLIFDDNSKELAEKESEALRLLKSALICSSELNEMEKEAEDINRQCDEAEAWITVSEMYDDAEFKEACFYYASKALNGGEPIIQYPEKSIERMSQLLGVKS